MSYEVEPLPFDPAAIPGLSERLLRSHYDNNYGGAVKRLGAIAKQLAELDMAAAPGYLLNGLKREELVAANSMLLHELYFEGLAGSRMGPAGDLARMIERDFGNLEHWRTQFAALGKALAGGSGWVLLQVMPRDGRLVNQWAPDHTHCLAGGVPLVALDMYEHAYHLDFGAQAARYVDAFMTALRWDAASARLKGIA
jgi:superoxide dismutase, Fe-Mn family